MITDRMITMDKLEFILNKSVEDGWNAQERRHTDWKENYELYRDKVIVNRLTQRQSVNIPLMKQIIKTLLSKIDDFVDLQFENLDGDKQRELLYNLYWENVVKEDNKLVLKDIVDKKQVMLFGRSFQKWNVLNNKVKLHIIDPRNIRMDRFADPTDINTAKYIIEDNIFSTLSDLKANAMYDQRVVAKMEEFFKTREGLIKSGQAEEKLREKNEAMLELGDDYVDNPQIGQTIVQMQEGFLKIYNPEIGEEEIIFTVSGQIDIEDKPSRLILFADRLENIVDPNGNCKDHFWRYNYPYETWAEDVENVDLWCDSVADSVRVPNKIVNSWFSQTVENRTMRNFGMNYYNSSQSGEDGAFIPQTFEPRAWGWYPVPGNPNDLIKSIEIPQLTGNLEEINFVVNVAEKASAATAITQGVAESKRITLGEVQLLAGNALDRIQSMSKFYQQNWVNLGRKYVRLLEAMGDQIEAVRVFKKGRNTDMVFSKVITPKSWLSNLGYGVKVVSKKDKSVADLEEINKLNAIKSFMPNNKVLIDIIKQKLLDIGSLSPDQVKEILDEEKNTPIMPEMNQPGFKATQPSDLLNLGKPQPATRPAL